MKGSPFGITPSEAFFMKEWWCVKNAPYRDFIKVADVSAKIK